MIETILAAIIGYLIGNSNRCHRKARRLFPKKRLSECCKAPMWETRLGNKVCTKCKKLV